MRYEVIRSRGTVDEWRVEAIDWPRRASSNLPIRGTVDEWRVEAIDYEQDGQVFVTIFSGPDAERRAKEYAEWKNATKGTTRQPVAVHA